MNMETTVIITIKCFQINQISALKNTEGIDMLLNI